MADEMTVPAQLAQIHQQIENLADSVTEIKTTIRVVTDLDRSYGELRIHHEQVAKDLTFQWNRVDGLKEEVEGVDRKAEAWINKARGAWTVLAILGGLAQITLIAMIAWTFNHVRIAEDELLLLKYRMHQMEKSSDTPPPRRPALS